MEADKRRTSRGTAAGWGVALSLVFLVVYQLCIGPLAWLTFHGKLTENAAIGFAVAYTPMACAASTCEWYGNMVNHYLALWGVPPWVGK